MDPLALVSVVIKNLYTQIDKHLLLIFRRSAEFDQPFVGTDPRSVGVMDNAVLRGHDGFVCHHGAARGFAAPPTEAENPRR